MKKIKIVILAIIFCCYAAQPIFAIELQNNSQYNVKELKNPDNQSNGDDDQYSFELTTIGDVQYYFNNVPSYTITISSSKNGFCEVTYKNKNTNELFNKVYKNKFLLGNIENFQNLEQYWINVINNYSLLDQTLKNDINFKKINFKKFLGLKEDGAKGPSGATEGGGGSVAYRIDKLLLSRYGATYSNKAIGTSSQYGNSGVLKEDMSFYRTNSYSWFFYAKTSISTIASILSLSVSKVASIFKIAKDVGSGALVLYQDCNSHKYVANVNYNRHAYVNGSARQHAGKTIKGIAYVGDIGETYIQGSTSQDPTFNNLLSVAMLEYTERYN